MTYDDRTSPFTVHDIILNMNSFWESAGYVSGRKRETKVKALQPTIDALNEICEALGIEGVYDADNIQSIEEESDGSMTFICWGDGCSDDWEFSIPAEVVKSEDPLNVAKKLSYPTQIKELKYEISYAEESLRKMHEKLRELESVVL